MIVKIFDVDEACFSTFTLGYPDNLAYICKQIKR